MEFNTLVKENIVNKTREALRAKGYTTIIVKTGTDALTQIQKMIPNGASVMNGASVTLEQIGYVDYLATTHHTWKDVRSQIRTELDPQKRVLLRRQAALSDYYLGSVAALTQAGEFIVASNTGSQLPLIVYTAPNLIFVVSTKKIVPTMDVAMKRLDYVVPLEDADMRKHYGEGTSLNKIVIFRGENKSVGRKIHFIFVKENLGF